jgi:long-chain fatty acid transport protein
MQHALSKVALALLFAGASSASLANGLAINEQSASGMGTAFAGRASSALDASTVFGNPAGMSKLKRTQVSAGLAYVKPSTDIDNVGTNVAGTSKGDIAPNSLVPFGFMVTPINDDLHFGLGLYVPFGVISDNEKSFQGRYHGQYSKVQVTTLQPTLSYRVTPSLSVGFGPTLNKIDGKLTSSLATTPLTGTDTSVRIKGDDTAVGYNLGVLWDISQDLSWGLTYRSKVDYKLEGSTRFGNGAALGLGAYDASLKVTTPESIESSFSYRIDDRWTAHAGAVWTRWSRLDEIVAVNQGVTNPAFATVGEEMGWRDTWAYSLGASYQLNPTWVLRAGVALDATPTTNAHRNVRIPVGDRRIFALGAGWSPSADVTIDLAYSYIREEQVSVNQANGGQAAPGVFLKPAYSANYKNSAHGVGTQLTYRF